MTYLKRLLKGLSGKAFPDPGYTKTLDRKWLAAIRERFADREDLGRERAFQSYFANNGLRREDVFECFDLIETEYGYIAGLLRPEDSLEKLFTPVQTRNPFRSMTYEIMAGDRQLWLGDELEEKLRGYGIRKHSEWPPINTIGDFIKAWCGQMPPSNAT